MADDIFVACAVTGRAPVLIELAIITGSADQGDEA